MMLPRFQCVRARHSFKSIERHPLVASTFIAHHPFATRSAPRFTAVRSADDDEVAPDWDAEMQVLKQRAQAPSALETLRQIAAEDLETGRVLHYEDGLAIVADLNNDADVGTKLNFNSGAAGVLIWRRDDNLVYVAVLSGVDKVTVGDGVKCAVKAVLQLVDEVKGPVTKREYDIWRVPVAADRVGQIVDHLGCLPGSSDAAAAAGSAPTSSSVPLLNRQPDMESREPINAGLATGLKFVDALTPIGRGQSMLLTGPARSGKTATALDFIVGQRGAGVRCVYAAVGLEDGAADAARQYLSDHDALSYTTIVSAPASRPLAQRLAALYSAISIAEAARDAGSDALVILDDFRTMVDSWAKITGAIATLGPQYLVYRGKEAEGTGLENARPSTAEEEEALVEHEGMLVSVSAAQRRRFFSALIQRSAKLHRRLGGGTLTLVPVLTGQPATGSAQGQRARSVILQAKGLTQEMKDRMLAALDAKEGPAAGGTSTAGRGVSTDVIEELMSMTDGQTVLEADGSSEGLEGYAPAVNPNASASRIGSRAFPKALEPIATSLRFELSQAADAARFTAVLTDPAAQAEQRQAARARWALLQRRGHPVSPAELLIHLIALRKGLLDKCETPAEVQERLAALVAGAKGDKAAAAALASASSGAALSEAETEALEAALVRLAGQGALPA